MKTGSTNCATLSACNLSASTAGAAAGCAARTVGKVADVCWNELNFIEINRANTQEAVLGTTW